MNRQVIFGAALAVLAAGAFAITRDPAPVDKPYEECRASLPASGRDCEQERNDLDRQGERVNRGIDLLFECFEQRPEADADRASPAAIDHYFATIDACVTEHARAEGLTDEDLGRSLNRHLLRRR